MDYEKRHATYTEYLKMKVFERDWHGVSDAANDLRELEAQKPVSYATPQTTNEKIDVKVTLPPEFEASRTLWQREPAFLAIDALTYAARAARQAGWDLAPILATRRNRAQAVVAGAGDQAGSGIPPNRF